MAYRLELAPRAVQDIADLNRAGCKQAVAKITVFALAIIVQAESSCEVSADENVVFNQPNRCRTSLKIAE